MGHTFLCILMVFLHISNLLSIFLQASLSPFHNDCSKLSLYDLSGQGLCILRACLLTYKSRLQFYNPFPPKSEAVMAKIQTRRNQRNTSSNGAFPSDDFIEAANLNLFYIRSLLFIYLFWENASTREGYSY